MMLGLDLVTEPRGTTKLTLFGVRKSYRQRQEDFSFQAVLSSLAYKPKGGKSSIPGCPGKGRPTPLISALCFPAASLTARCAIACPAR